MPVMWCNWPSCVCGGRLRGFRGGSEFDPWFHRIVVNLAIDFVRRESARRRGQADWAGEQTRTGSSGEPQLPAGLRLQEVSRIFDELAAWSARRDSAPSLRCGRLMGMSTEDVAQADGHPIVHGAQPSVPGAHHVAQGAASALPGVPASPVGERESHERGM